MKALVKAFDGLPKWAKIILALPGLDIVWAFYRLARSIAANSILGIVLAIVMIFACPIAVWVIDIITLVLMNKVLWIN